MVSKIIFHIKFAVAYLAIIWFRSSTTGVKNYLLFGFLNFYLNDKLFK